MSNEICRSHLAAIFVTLLSIVSVGAFGWSVATWPQETLGAAGPSVENPASVQQQSFGTFVAPARERDGTKGI